MFNSINNYEKIEIVIFDMDGTLYPHDGENGTFKNSSLNKAVISNSIRFVVNREKCDRKKAAELVQKALVVDTIGISNFMAKRYGITRAQFFDSVWNINPKRIIKNKTQSKFIRKIAEQNKKLFLLTGAPRVWMENVMEFLKLEDIFERKYHGEMFGNKDEIFKILAKEFDPKTILSIGDQFETDLKPAIDFGMFGFQIKKPSDLQKLI